MESSPVSSNSSQSPSQQILTPSRKVKALLAQFEDSDSDSSPLPKERARTDAEATRSGSAAPSDGSEDEDDLPIAGMSRMAARLLGNTESESRNTVVAQSGDNVQEADTQDKFAGSANEQSTNEKLSPESSEDELTRPAPRRRLLLKRKSSSAVPSSPAEGPAQPPSPMFFPSPSADHAPPVASSPGPSQTAGTKFKALVEKHRKARIEKEAAEAAKKAAARNQSTEKLHKQRGSSPADDSDEGSDDSDIGAAKRLTKDAKPTRKASKKAMDEMKRETQRIGRNMQLAHQARTRKKITKESLLARFNFAVPAAIQEPEPKGDQSATASSELGSDGEALKGHDTPPTSPLQDPSDFDKAMIDTLPLIETAAPLDTSNLIVEAPAREAIGLEALPVMVKGKGKATDLGPQDPIEVRLARSEQPNAQTTMKDTSRVGSLDVRARVAEMLKSQRNKLAIDDLDDLEVITGKGSMRKYAAFERLPKRKAKETSSHLALRSLAHLHDNERNNHMTASEMQTSLRRAARLQAVEERQQKIAELKAKGVVIQTAEERERDQQEVEDLVERARQEAAEISRREKAKAKKDGTFVKDGFADDEDSDDEDFEEQVDEDAGEESEGESDDDEGDDQDDEEEGGVEAEEANLIDELAGEADTDEDGHESGLDKQHDILEGNDDDQEAFKTPALRRSRSTRFVVDDDDELAGDVAIDSPVLPQPAKTPQSISRSARKQIPGLQMSDDLPLGLTQAFAATMAESQTQDDDEISQQQDTLRVLRDLPSPYISVVPQLNRLDSLDIVSDSQPASQTQPVHINLSLSQSQTVPESPSLGRQMVATQFTPSQVNFEPTQDEGYLFSPFQGNRFASETPQQLAPHSTVDTVIVPDGVDASPIVQRKGRLQRGRVQSVATDDETEDVNKSAFEMMRRAAKRADVVDFDKSRSKARNIVDEAAEESDDEYAGLGGASDDDGNDEEDEDDREMIDHDTQVGKGDEGKLAGMYADRERKDDEAAVSKLLKDITTGALRRKRGANDDLDLSDEEDAVARRREAKRREFAKMRRELLKDEAVGKIAEDIKKEAFLKSIEDREPVSDDEDFDQPETPLDESAQASRSLQPEVAAKDTQDTQAGEKRKRPLRNLPRTRNSTAFHLLSVAHLITTKPATLAEIRESVSFLIEEPDSQANTIDLGLSDSEDEPEAYVDLDRHLQSCRSR